MTKRTQPTMLAGRRTTTQSGAQRTRATPEPATRPPATVHRHIRPPRAARRGRWSAGRAVRRSRAPSRDLKKPQSSAQEPCFCHERCLQQWRSQLTRPNRVGRTVRPERHGCGIQLDRTMSLTALVVAVRPLAALRTSVPTTPTAPMRSSMRRDRGSTHAHQYGRRRTALMVPSRASQRRH